MPATKAKATTTSAIAHKEREVASATEGRLPLRQELHKLGAAASPLLPRRWMAPARTVGSSQCGSTPAGRGCHRP
jgi:hypothetical protein